MVNVLMVLALVSGIGGIAVGFLQGGGLVGFLVSAGSGTVTAIVFYALASILDRVSQIQERLDRFERKPPPPKLGNSKADLNKLKDFTL